PYETVCMAKATGGAALGWARRFDGLGGVGRRAVAGSENAHSLVGTAQGLGRVIARNASGIAMADFAVPARVCSRSLRSGGVCGVCAPGRVGACQTADHQDI